MSPVMVAAAFLTKLTTDLRRSAGSQVGKKPNETSPTNASAASPP